MKIGFVGLGKMGSQIVSKLIAADHEIVVFDVNQDAVKACEKIGAYGATSREDLVNQLGHGPVLWLMIPADFVEAELYEYRNLLPKNSIVVDGGNSNYELSIKRAKLCGEDEISFVDVGTSGGIMGLSQGFSLMVGGDEEAFATIEPILKALSMPNGGYDYFGPCGYGHYIKMIHNGIEYAVMQSYAEGYDLLKYGPLPDIDLAKVAEVWQMGSIINSKLNELIVDILRHNPELEGIDGYVAASGEGEWTYQNAQKSNINLPALKAALEVRQASQNGKTYFATKLLAALRNSFGGHQINKN